MIAPLLLLVLSAPVSESAGVVTLLTRRTGASPALSAAVVRDLRTALSSAGLDSPLGPEELASKLKALGVKDSTYCAAKRACVVELGRQLNAGILVSLNVGQAAQDLSFHVEALRVADGVRLASDTLVLPLDEVKTSAAAFAHFTQKLRAALGSPVISDTPKIEPPPQPPPLVLLPPVDPPQVVHAPAPPSHRASWVLGGAALVAGGTAAVFTGVGLAEKSRLDARVDLGPGRFGSELTRSEANALAGSANGHFAAGLACGLASAALAAAAVAFWGEAPAPTPGGQP